MHDETGEKQNKKKPPRHFIEASIISTSLSDFAGILGAYPSFVPPPVPEPIIEVTAWPWADPMDAILHFGGWTLEEAVYDDAVAARFGQLWSIRQAMQKLKAERQEAHENALAPWWRQQGCPVPCTHCGETGACGCGATS